MTVKKLPVKKVAKTATKMVRPTAKTKIAALKVKAKAVKATYVKTNKPPAYNETEAKLCMAGKWDQAAAAHQKRTGVLYRRSLVAVAVVYREWLQQVLDAIKIEIKAGR